MTGEQIAPGVLMWHFADDGFAKFFSRQLLKPHLNRYPSGRLTDKRHLGGYLRTSSCGEVVVVDIAFHRTHMNR